MNDEAQRIGKPGGEPQGYFVVVPPAVEEDRFEFTRLVATLLGAWKAAAIGGIVGGLIAAGLSMFMSPLYRAYAVIAPVEANGGMGSSLRNQLGGLAALAGVDIGNSASRKEESFAKLASDGFARDFITTDNLIPLLFRERWDPNTKTWRAGDKAPTIGDAVTRFTRDVRTVSEDRKNGLVTVTVEFGSPDIAANWANRMVELVNERLRVEATENAQRSIEYLNHELDKTNVVELRQAIFRLIENQVNNAMLANVQREYAFRFIDRAVAPEKRFSPRRTILTAIGVLVGAMFGVAVVLMRRAWVRERERARAAA
jgi:LPS O-antigen subunit length determinant protein (WzzB/FepE family)